MSNTTPTAPRSPFDSIRHNDTTGEYWLARELSKLLEYADWDNFKKVIQKAMNACKGSEQSVLENFRDVTEVSKRSNNRNQSQKSYRLTRYACYLIAMNADPTKLIVAEAQSYFAVKTREAELSDIEAWKLHTIEEYVNKGYSLAYAKRRIGNLRVQDEWEHEVTIRNATSDDIAILTNKMHEAMFDISIEEHKELKGFIVKYRKKKGVTIKYHPDPLPDALTPAELTIRELGIATSTILHRERDSYGLTELERDVQDAGKLAADYRKGLEAELKKPVVSSRDMRKEPDGGLFSEHDSEQLATPDEREDRQ